MCANLISENNGLIAITVLPPLWMDRDSVSSVFKKRDIVFPRYRKARGNSFFAREHSLLIIRREPMIRVVQGRDFARPGPGPRAGPPLSQSPLLARPARVKIAF